MSSGFNPFKNRYKKNFKPNTSGMKDPLIYSNHSSEAAIDSRILYPHLPFFYQGAFIDPGYESCAIRIVRFFVELNFIQVLWFGIHNFGMEITQIMSDMENSLNPILEKLKDCHHIVIESQLMKSRTNFRTFQHMISYIEMNVRNQRMRPVIVEVDIKLKTTFLGGPTTKKQNGGEEIKEWSKAFARYASKIRGDFLSISIVDGCCKKQDEDLSDTLCYDFAWWLYFKSIEHMWKK